VRGTPEDVIFGDELRKWADRMGVIVEVTVDNGPHGWKGRVGFVTQLISRAGFDPAHTLAFVCGPEVMMRTSANELRQRGVPAAKIRLSMERNMKCGVGLCGPLPTSRRCSFASTAHPDVRAPRAPDAEVEL